MLHLPLLLHHLLLLLCQGKLDSFCFQKFVSILMHNLHILLIIHLLCPPKCTNSVVNPNARPRRLANIATTWGPKANAIYVVHDSNEYSKGADIDKDDSNTYTQNLIVPNHITVDKGVERLEHVI